MSPGYQLVIKEQNTKYNTNVKYENMIPQIISEIRISLPLTHQSQHKTVQNIILTPDLTLLLAKKKKCNSVNSRL